MTITRSLDRQCCLFSSRTKQMSPVRYKFKKFVSPIVRFVLFLNCGHGCNFVNSKWVATMVFMTVEKLSVIKFFPAATTDILPFH